MSTTGASNERKTIFITIYDGDTEKNVLRSGTFDLLKQSGHRFVLLICSPVRFDYYKQTFEGEQVSVELLPNAANALERLWYFIGWNSLPTRAVVLRRHMWLAKGWPRWRFALGTVFGFLGRFRVWRAFLRFVYAISPDSHARALFETYQPDLLFSPNMFSPDDCRLLRQAKRRGVKTIVTAKSWDVLTTKAFTRVKADRLLVFNEFNRQEAIELGDYDPAKIVVTGFPQFDIYSRDDIFMSRDEFFRTIGADPAKRLVLVAPPGDWMTPHTVDILAAFDRRIDEGRFGPLQVLVRYHPKYPDASEKLESAHLIKDRPGTLLSKKKETSIDMGVANSFAWTFTNKDIVHLANSIKHSDVVVNTASTLTLDAAALDRPVVLLGYDGDQKLAYWDSIARVYEREHYRHVTDAHAAPVVQSHDEFEAAIKRFLDDPDYLRAEREQLKKDMLYKVDGKSTERVARAVLEMLE